MARRKPNWPVIRQHFNLPMMLERYGVVLRGVNQHKLCGDCPLPQHTSTERNTFKVSKGEKGWGWSCFATSCYEARNVKDDKGNFKKGGGLVDFVQFMEKLPELYDAGDLLESWLPQAENSVRPEAPQVAPVKVDEAPSDVNENPKRYMKEVEDWIFDLIRRRGGESWEDYAGRMTKEIKVRLYASYMNGVKVGKGQEVEFKGPAVHSEVRRAS